MHSSLLQLAENDILPLQKVCMHHESVTKNVLKVSTTAARGLVVPLASRWVKFHLSIKELCEGFF